MNLLALLPKAKLIGAAALIVALTYGAGYLQGAHRATVRAMKVAADLEAKQLTELNKLNDLVRERERQHEAKVNQIVTEFGASYARNRAADEARVAALRAGTDRLRLPVSAARCPTGSGEALPAPSGADVAAVADIAPETAAALYSIAAAGDEAIRQLTGLQAYTSQLYTTCQELAK